MLTHMLTNALVALPSCVTEPVAITKAAVPSSGYIGNCSSITVSCRIVVTHTELFKVCGKTSKLSSAFDYISGLFNSLCNIF